MVVYPQYIQIPTFHYPELSITASLGSVRRRMHQMDAQPRTDLFEMGTGITGAVVGVKPLTKPKAPGGDHHLGDQDFDGLVPVEPGADHISRGIINNGMQDRLFELAPVAQLGAMHEVGHPQLTESVESKGPTGGRRASDRATVKLLGNSEPVQSRPTGFDAVPDTVGQQPFKDYCQCPVGVLFAESGNGSGQQRVHMLPSFIAARLIGKVGKTAFAISIEPFSQGLGRKPNGCAVWTDKGF